MLPLACSQIPASPEELATALQEGFRKHGLAAHEVRASGEWPRLAELSIDLTGAQFSRANELPKAGADPQPGVSIERLAISAAPFYFEKIPAQLDLHASKVECGFASDATSGFFLRLLRASSGSLSLESRRADLESALQTIARDLLAKQGADVKSAHLELIDRGPHSLGFRAEITAKAFLMTARVAVTGQLDLDEQLNLRVSHLATSGDGMIANLAGGFLRPRFADIEKRTIPLAAYSFAGVALHDARISGGEALRIEARFGA